MKTNVDGSFLKLIDNHFPKKSKLHKIFNKNTVKVSYMYSCMPNIENTIKVHNKEVSASRRESDKIQVYLAIAESRPFARLKETAKPLASSTKQRSNKETRMKSSYT